MQGKAFIQRQGRKYVITITPDKGFKGKPDSDIYIPPDELAELKRKAGLQDERE